MNKENMSDKTESNEYVNEEFVNEETFKNEIIYITKKEYIEEEQYNIDSKLQTEKELLNLGETIAFNKFNKELELNQYKDRCSKLFQLLDKYEDNEDNIHIFFKKKCEREFNEILKMIKLIYEYQKKDNDMLLNENIKLKDTLEDIKEELEEESLNNVMYEEKLDLFNDREKSKIKSIKNKYIKQVLKLDRLCNIFIYIIGYTLTNLFLYLFLDIKLDIISFTLIVILLLCLGEYKYLYEYISIYSYILFEIVIYVCIYYYLIKLIKKYKNNYLKKNN
jgi:hypothetical protein